jgi:hypothetical protein
MPRKRKAPAVIPSPAPAANRTAFLNTLWFQAAAVFVGGVGLGMFVLGPVGEWVVGAMDTSTVADNDNVADNAVPNPAFGGTSQGMASAASVSSVAASAATSAVPAMSTDPLLKIRLDVREVARGSVGGADRPGHIVVRDEAAQKKLWDELAARGASVPPMSSVPLRDKMLVAVFSGDKPTGNHDIEATHAVLTDADLRAYVRETTPGKNCDVTPAATSPYVFILVDPTDMPVRVLRDSEVVDCL